MNILIYTLSDDDGVRYVGKTKNLKQRLKSHIDEAKQFKEYNYRTNWIRSLIAKNYYPIIEVVDIVDDRDWIFWEQYWISQFRAWNFKLVNSTNGGDQPPAWKGKTHSYEYRQRRALLMSGSNNPAYGGLNEEWKGNISKSLKGRKLTDNHRHLLGTKILQMSTNGDIIANWPTISEASKTLGISHSGISACINGTRQKAGGYKWKRYVDKI